MNSIEAVAQVIELAVAPVFLLAGIAGLLRTLLRRESTVLWRRIALINWAIRSCVASGPRDCD